MSDLRDHTIEEMARSIGKYRGRSFAEHEVLDSIDAEMGVKR